MTQRYQTVADMLKFALQFHRELAEYYQRRSQNTADQRLQMVQQYLARHAQNVAEGIQRFCDDASPALMQSWLDNVPELDALPVLEDVAGSHSVGSPEVDAIDLALAVDDKLIQAYEALAREAGTDSVRAVFDDLAQQQKTEQRRLQMASVRLQDI